MTEPSQCYHKRRGLFSTSLGLEATIESNTFDLVPSNIPKLLDVIRMSRLPPQPTNSRLSSQSPRIFAANSMIRKGFGRQSAETDLRLTFHLRSIDCIGLGSLDSSVFPVAILILAPYVYQRKFYNFRTSMKLLRPRHTVLLLICAISSSKLQVKASKCDCHTKEEEDKTRDHLQLVTRISALKLLPSIREIIYQSGAEKTYLLDRAKYEVVRDLRADYGNLIAETDIISSLETLTDSIRELVNDEKTLTLKEIETAVNESITKFHNSILPSAFLCFALGTCRTANSLYMKCMRNNVHDWTIFFGDEPQRMTKKTSDSIAVFRRVDSVLQTLHNILITVENQITSECARRFTNVTACPKCLTDDSVGYCRSSCQQAAFDCVENLAREWLKNIDELYELTRSYGEGFQQLVHGIGIGIRRLVESKAPKLAKVVVSKCGPLQKDNVHITASTQIRPVKPKEPKTHMKQLVEQLRGLRKCWAQIADRTCSDASEQNFCWNGTNIIRLQLADEFSIGTKDVRPRPKDTWLESSGQPYDTDDEDFISGGSGSGMPFEEVHDDAATVYTIAPVVTSPATSPPTPPTQIIEDSTRAFPQILPWTALLTLIAAVLLSI